MHIDFVDSNGLPDGEARWIGKCIKPADIAQRDGSFAKLVRDRWPIDSRGEEAVSECGVAETDKSEKSDNPYYPLACNTVEDLFGPMGRERVRMVTQEWLRRQRLTVTEFMHNAAALNKFEAAGNSYQHAVQRMAVTLSSKSKVPVVQYIKALTALSTAGIRRINVDDRAGLFPEHDEQGLVGFAETLGGQGNAAYLFNGALAKYLAVAPSWTDKLDRLMSLANAASALPDAQTLIVRTVDDILADIVDDSKVLIELVGPERRLGEILLVVLQLFHGKTQEMGDVAPGVRRLAEGIASGGWPAARCALARFVFEIVQGTVSLGASDLTSELEAFGAVVESIQSLYGPDFVREDYIEAFVTRSRRFVTPEALFHFTSSCKTPSEKLVRVLELEAKVHGAANKRALAPYVLNFLSAPDFEDTFATEAPGSQRLRLLAAMQRQIQKSAFPEGARDKIVGMLDAIAVRVETQGNLLLSLEGRYANNPAERVDMLVKLFENGVFTHGALSSKARRALLSAISSPGFAARYTINHATRKQDVLMELVMQLKTFGISPEESLRAMSPG